MLIPEFTKPEAIALVWPEHLSAGTGKLKSFYVNFINKLSEKIKVLVLVNNSSDRKMLGRTFPNPQVELIEIPEISDIWIRDFGPIFFKSDNKYKPLYFKYQPSYWNTVQQKRIIEKNKVAGIQLSKKLGYNNPGIIKVNGIGLNLDGGNFIFNSSGTAIVTNRLISDNESILIEDVQKAFLHQVGITKLIMIPSEPEDDTGHADGAVRFVKDDVVVVLKYPKEAEAKSRAWAETVAHHLKSSGLKVVRITCGEPEKGIYTYRKADETKGTFENAWGNYLNYLRIRDSIFLPVYETSLDKDAIKTIKEVSECEVIPIKIPKELAAYGGLLNCITLPIFR